MLIVFNVIFPIFAIILIGYAGRKFGVFNESTTHELNRYVVWLALPAQLFEFTTNNPFDSDPGIWGFTIAFAMGAFTTFLCVLMVQYKRTGNITIASFDGLSASYANCGYMGLPLCILALGNKAVAAPLIGTLVVVCGLFSISVAFIEGKSHSEKKWYEILFTILKALGKNPLIISPILGLIWSFTGLGLYQPIRQVFLFLGASASPCALIAMGLFLAQKSNGKSSGLSLLVITKLILQPILTWLIARYVLDLSPYWIKASVLISALPTGTGPFMMAQYYEADGRVISQVVLITTIASIFTLSFLVWLMV